MFKASMSLFTAGTESPIPPGSFSSLVSGPVYAAIHDGNDLYLAGQFSAALPDNAPNVIRVNPSTGAGLPIDNIMGGFDGIVNSVAVDGNFLYAGGTFTTFKGASCPRIAKVDMTTGNLADGFLVGTGFDNTVQSIQVSGSSLWVGGRFGSYNGTTRQFIAKLNSSTGAIDGTFDSASGFQDWVNAILVNENDLYCAGYFTSYKGSGRVGVAKLNATTAALDGTFNPGSGMGRPGIDEGCALCLDGNVLWLGGFWATFNGNGIAYMVKLNSVTCAVDTNFQPSFSSGQGGDIYIRSIIKDGTSLYVGSNATVYGGVTRAGVVKIDASTAAHDATFSAGTGIMNTGSVNSLVKVGDGIYLGGDFLTFQGTSIKRFCRLSATTGALDAGFPGRPTFENSVNSIVYDGTNLVMGGQFVAYGGTPRRRMAKFNKTTWALDPTFDTSNGFDNQVSSIVKIGTSIYAAGYFGNYGGTARLQVAKINATTAALDATFDTSTGPNGTATQIIRYTSDGFILIAGDFSTYKGTARIQLAKLDPTTAALDATFDTSTGPNSSQPIYAVLEDAGYFYIGGAFTSYKGTARRRIAKISATTAALDATFASNNGASAVVNGIAKYGNALYIGGNFTFYESTSRVRLAKIDATTAALDTNFDTSTGASGVVRAFYISSDGSSLIAGGTFATYKGVTVGNIVKVSTTDASIIGAFDTASAFNGTVQQVQEVNSNLWVGGNYNTYKNQLAISSATLNMTTAALVT